MIALILFGIAFVIIAVAALLMPGHAKRGEKLWQFRHQKGARDVDKF